MHVGEINFIFIFFENIFYPGASLKNKLLSNCLQIIYQLMKTLIQ